MRKINLLAATSFQLGAWIALFTLFLLAPAFAATIYVSPGGGGSGTTPASPTTLQAALTAAQGNGEADTIYLLAGPYPATGGPFSYNASQSDQVRLTGGWNAGFTSQYRGMDPASMTALNGQNANRVFEVRSEAAGVTLQFTIENIAFLNGLANVNAIHGAGLRSNSANGGTVDLFVRRCLFENNNGVAGASNTSGGGIYTNGYAEIYDSVFSNNAARGGGGVYLGYATPNTNSLESRVERCTFTNNKTLGYSCSQPGVPTCYDGGSDITSVVSPVIRECTFSGDGTNSGGGAINHSNGGNLRLINSTISGKVSWFWGGGIHIWDANAEIYNSLIANNFAGRCNLWGRGGGIAIYDPNDDPISGNTLPFTPRTVKVFNSTFVNNDSNGVNDGLLGKAIDNRVQSLSVYNSIFWNNGTVGQSPIYTSVVGTTSVNHSDYQYGWTGTGGNNINIEPAFVDFSGSNFRLTSGSPCKDAGTNDPGGAFMYTFYPTTSDRDGRSRIIDGGISDTADMGAYEFDGGQYANATGRGDPNLAYDPTNARFLAVYSALDGAGGSLLSGRLINPDGTPASSEFPISEQKSYSRQFSSVAYDAFHKKFIVVWDIFNASSNDRDVQGQMVNPDGTLDDWNFIVSSQAAIDEWRPMIAYDDTAHQTLVVWNHEYLPDPHETDVLGRFFVRDVAQGPAFPIANTATIFEEDPVVAFDTINKKFLVIWSDERNFGTAGAEIFGRLINSNRTLDGTDFSITTGRSGSQFLPGITFNPSTRKYLVAFSENTVATDDIYGRLVNYDKTLVGDIFPISTATGVQDWVSVACHPLARRYLAVWQDSRNLGTTDKDIYGQWIREDGSLQDTNFPVSNAASAQDYPKLVFGLNSFLVAYEKLLSASPINLDVEFVKIDGPAMLVLPLILKQ